jgi:dolichyl-phosphate beta-glucosyltransferase
MPVTEFKHDIDLFGFYYCFVNDGSTDDTLAILNEISIQYPDRVMVYDQQPNKGKAEAVRNGILSVLNWKEFDYIGFMDADMATPTSEMVKLIEIASKFEKEMVVGSRIKRMGVNIDRKTSRHFAGRFIATMISTILDLPTYDTQCGAKIFKTGLAKELFKDKFISRWLFDVELFFRAKSIFNENIFQKVYEYPLNQWYEKGESKVSVWYFFKIPFEMYKMKRKYKNVI